MSGDHAATVKVAGANLVLRYAGPADAQALFELASDPAVTRWFSWGPYRSADEPAAYIAGLQAEREAGVRLDFLVETVGTVPSVSIATEGTDTSVQIGVIGLNELSARDRRAMVGTWLGREHWGTGANATAKALILHLAFEVCGLERVGAYSDLDNQRSTRALEKLGFRHEGVLRAWHRHGDVPHDVNVFGLLRDEWPGAPFDVTVEGRPPAAWLLRPGAGPS
jgi:[ribosomal protein S5]-alanine N-acetyltransferase